MRTNNSDKRKRKGCPLPLVYFSLQMGIVGLVLYMAYILHIDLSILLAIFFALAVVAVKKTSKVCARQRVYAQMRKS